MFFVFHLFILIFGNSTLGGEPPAIDESALRSVVPISAELSFDSPCYDLSFKFNFLCSMVSY